MKSIKKTQVSSTRMTPLAMAVAMMPFISCYSAANDQVPSSSAEVQAAYKSDEIQEVIVTARKVAEPVSKTPIAITVISGDDLKNKGVISVSDIGQIAPSVIMARDPFGVNINIRGVTTTDQTSKGTQGIGFNVDGVGIGRPLAQGLSFFDVERVEVLSGPQGTLYGGSTTGGTINVITNKPSKALDASADVELGNYNTKRYNAMINAPITDALAIRFAVNSDDRDGYLEPTLGSGGGPLKNDQHDRAARLSAFYIFNPATTLLLSGTEASQSGVGSGKVPNFTGVQGLSGSAQRNVFGNPFGGNIDDQYHRFNAEFNTEFSGIRLTYVGASSKFHARDLTSGTFDPETNKDRRLGNPQYAWRNYRGDFNESSNEIRLANVGVGAAKKGTINWVIGASKHNDSVHESDHNLNAPVSNPTIAASTNGIDPVNVTTHTSSGIFGQSTYFMTDDISIVAGLRHSNDSLTRVGTFAAGPVPGCENALEDCIGGPNNGTNSASKNTYRLGLNYQFTPQQLIYTSVATGYKPGGFNDFDPVSKGVGPYVAEQMTAYEIGYKARPTSSLSITSDVFYYDYAKDQISSLTVVEGNFVIFTRPVAAKIYGWENSFIFRATQNDMVTGGVNTLHSAYGKFNTGLFQNVNFTGKSLDKTPALTANLGYSHYFDLDNGDIKFYFGARYSSSYVLSDFVGGVQDKQNSFTRSNANLTYTAKDGRLTFQAYVNNIENKVQMTSLGGNMDAGVSEPRFFGIRMGIKY